MTESAESMSKKLDRISEIVIQGMRTADAPLWFLRGLGNIINSCPECGGDTGPLSENYDEEVYEYSVVAYYRCFADSCILRRLAVQGPSITAAANRSC